jgi:hypothetical protein
MASSEKRLRTWVARVQTETLCSVESSVKRGARASRDPSRGRHVGAAATGLAAVVSARSPCPSPPPQPASTNTPAQKRIARTPCRTTRIDEGCGGVSGSDPGSERPPDCRGARFETSLGSEGIMNVAPRARPSRPRRAAGLSARRSSLARRHRQAIVVLLLIDSRESDELDATVFGPTLSPTRSASYTTTYRYDQLAARMQRPYSTQSHG